MWDALRHVFMIGILIRPVGGFESVTSAMTFNAALIVFPVLGIFNPEIFSVNKSPLRFCLVEHLSNMFLVFKQHYTYFHTLFHP